MARSARCGWGVNVAAWAHGPSHSPQLAKTCVQRLGQKSSHAVRQHFETAVHSGRRFCTGGSSSSGATSAGTSSSASTAAAAQPSAVENAVKIVAGVGAFLAFEDTIRNGMVASGANAYMPTQIGSMLGAFACLSGTSLLAPAAAITLHTALLPGVGWVNRWLPVFLVPVQVMLPTLSFPGGASEAGGLALLLGGGWLATVCLSSRLASRLLTLLPAVVPMAASAAAAAPKRTLLLPALWLLAAAAAAPFGADPNFWGGGEEAARALRGGTLVALGVGSFALAVQRKMPGHLCFLACGAATIAGTAALASFRGETYGTVVKRDYLAGAHGPQGSGDFLIWCMGPALVATGVQMFGFAQGDFRLLLLLLLFDCCLIVVIIIFIFIVDAGDFRFVLIFIVV
ncbi:unnamed protein product [Polarella glacialis]|uniref:Uncharacterized protein n=1 Tax=Polarella glacialis TaxID=89957 RepID=A0A813JZS2_POLGL|nr:unnamed protein product [Polarella glacialis]